MKMEKEIKTALENVQHFLENTELAPVKTDYREGIFSAEFNSEPSKELIDKIRDLVFCTDEIEISNISELFVLSTKLLKIDFVNYPMFVRLFQQMKAYGFKMQCADISKGEIYFRYALGGRFVLNYEELNELQNIVNPEIREHDSLRVVGYEGAYSLRVNLIKG